MNYFLIVMILITVVILPYVGAGFLSPETSAYSGTSVLACCMVLRPTSSYSSADFSGLDCISLLDAQFLDRFALLNITIIITTSIKIVKTRAPLESPAFIILILNYELLRIFQKSYFHVYTKCKFFYWKHQKHILTKL